MRVSGHYHYNRFSNIGFKGDPLSFFGVVFPLALAFLFLLLSLVIPYQYNKAKRLAENGIKVEGVVTEILPETYRDRKNKKKESIRYYSAVRYTDQSGRTHEIQLSGKRSIGKNVPLIYDPASPSEAKFHNENQLIGFVIGGVIFLIVILFCFLWFILKLKNYLRVKRLLSNGTRIQATITEVISKILSQSRYKAGTATIVGGANYQYDIKSFRSRLRAKFEDAETNSTYEFVSHDIYGKFDESTVGKQAEIIIDPVDPSNYYFYIENLH